MRFFICLIPLLCACTSTAVRCDSHLLPINVAGAAVGKPPIAPSRGAP